MTLRLASAHWTTRSYVPASLDSHEPSVTLKYRYTEGRAATQTDPAEPSQIELLSAITADGRDMLPDCRGDTQCLAEWYDDCAEHALWMLEHVRDRLDATREDAAEAAMERTREREHHDDEAPRT